MKINLNLHETIYNCDVKITDARGTRSFTIGALDFEEAASFKTAETEVYGDHAVLTVSPNAADYQGVLNEVEWKNLKERLAEKALSKLLSMLEKALLLVGCTYELTNLCEGCEVDLQLDGYPSGNTHLNDLLELYPVLYMFYEAKRNGVRLSPQSAFATNRKTVLRVARSLVISDFGFHLLVTYPFQMGIVKHQTRDKKIFKNLRRYHELPEEKRQKLQEQLKK